MEDNTLVVSVSDDDMDDLIADDTNGMTSVTDDQDDVIDDEKRAIREEGSDDTPVGVGNSDPGIESDDWEAREMHRGVGDNEDEDVVESLGFSVEDGSGNNATIDTFGDDTDI